MVQRDEHKSWSATPAAIAAALAMLGVSVGVDVQELFAASPQDQIESKQEKIRPKLEGKGLHQRKRLSGAEQGKVESFQNKAAGTLQQKVSPIQGNLPAVQNKAGGVPSLQNKAGGVPE